MSKICTVCGEIFLNSTIVCLHCKNEELGEIITIEVDNYSKKFRGKFK